MNKKHTEMWYYALNMYEKCDYVAKDKILNVKKVNKINEEKKPKWIINKSFKY